MRSNILKQNMASELSKIVLKKDDLTEVQVYLHGKDSRCYMCDVEITIVSTIKNMVL